MTTQGIENLRKVKQQIDTLALSDFQRAYPVCYENLEKAKKYYLEWLDVHNEYALGLERLPIDRESEEKATRMISLWVSTRANSYRHIINAKIPVEVYFLVHYFFQIFNQNISFVLQEDRRFESVNLADELKSELRNLQPPETGKSRSRVQLLTTSLYEKHLHRISYDANEYNTPQSWLILFHEAGHDLYDFAMWNNVNPKPHEMSLKELVIDLMACKVIGPAYALAFANYHRIWPGGGGGETHLSEPSRIYAFLKSVQQIVEKLSGLDSLYFQKLQDAQATLLNMWKRLKDSSREEQRSVDEVFDSIQSGIQRYLTANSVDSFESFMLKYQRDAISYYPKLDNIVKMLEKEIPVAADPRILFNAIANDAKIDPMLVTESMKRWAVVSKWRSLEGALAT